MGEKKQKEVAAVLALKSRLGGGNAGIYRQGQAGRRAGGQQPGEGTETGWATRYAFSTVSEQQAEGGAGKGTNGNATLRARAAGMRRENCTWQVQVLSAAKPAAAACMQLYSVEAHWRSAAILRVQL